MTNGVKNPVMIQSKNIEDVDEYLYLGRNISFEEPTYREVENVIKKAWNKYWMEDGLKEFSIGTQGYILWV